MKNLGFKYANGIFYRAINDVVQILELETTRYDVHIHYGIFPLCCPMYFDIWPRDFRCHFHWYTEIRDGVKRDAGELMSATHKTISKKVLPFFEIGVDSKSAYAIRRYHWKSIFHDTDMMWLALKNRDYENAYLHLAALFAQHLGLIRADTDTATLAASPEVREKFENWTAREDSVLREQVQAEVDRSFSSRRKEERDAWFSVYYNSAKFREQQRQEMRDTLDHIDQRDDEYFHARIEENEGAFLEFIRKVEKNPRKNWT